MGSGRVSRIARWGWDREEECRSRDGVGKSVDPGMVSGRVSIQGWGREEECRSRDGIGKSIPDGAVGMGSGRVSIQGWDREEYPGFIPYRVIPYRRALSLSDSFHPQILSIVSFMTQADVSVVCSEVRECRMQWSIRVRFVQ